MFLILFALLHVYNIFASEQVSSLTTAPSYVTVMKSKMEAEKREKEAKDAAAAPAPSAPPAKSEREEKKESKKVEVVTSDYSNIYLSKIFNNSIFNIQINSIKSTNTKVQNLIELIGKATGIDFVIDPDVTGSTGNLNFKNVSAGFILNYVLTHNNPQLALIKDMNVWRVMLRSKAEDYIKLIERHELTTAIISINYANINERFRDLIEKGWNNIVAETKALSSIIIDSDRKKIFVKAFPKQIQDFEKFVNELDKRITQIRIDAIIVFAEKNYNFSFGINWSGIYNRQSSIVAKKRAFDFAGLGGTLRDYPTPTLPVDPRDGNLFVDPNNFAMNLFTRNFNTPREARPASISDTFISIPFVFGGPDLNLRRLNLLLNAAENEEKVKIVSKPSIITSDNENAKILIGETIPIQATSIDVLAVAVQNITSINYKDVGISLEVRPSVSPDKQNVKLEIFLEESQVIAGSTVTNDRGIMQNPPIIDIVKIHNKVNLRNGQTVVVGGLSRCDQRKGQNKVPYLHKLPVLGKWLFTGTSRNKEEFEQYVFITPTIID